ncbi:MAG: serine/threonine protein kinase [Acidiferrobacterales bacterium]
MTEPQHHVLPAGARIESYEIKEVLGIGGFGVTYKAFDHSLHHDVAVKEYFPSNIAVRQPDRVSIVSKSDDDTPDYDEGLKRFLHEARTLAKFREPNIVRVSRFLESSGTAYLVMDYEDGEPLSTFIRDGHAFTEREMLGIMIPILRGLRAVHAQDILHRDIKPANIYLRKNGSPVLLDFGAARQSVGSDKGRVATMVTPGYAPFEQYYTLDDYGPWSDLYGAGATIYHCITSITPAAATDRVAALHAGKADPLGDLKKLLGDQYSVSFLETVAWMLEPLAKNRPRTIDQALEALAKRETPVAAPKTSAEIPANNEAAKQTDVALPKTVQIDVSNHDDLSWAQEAVKAVGVRPADHGAAAHTHSTERSPTRLDPQVVSAMAQVLATYLGPIARLLVTRAAKQASGPDALIGILAEEFEDPEQKSAFAREARMVCQ